MGGFESRTLTGAVTLTGSDPQFIRMDPGGADRAVTLPTAALNIGSFFCILNSADADETLTVDTTLALINQGEWAWMGVDQNRKTETPAWVVVANSSGIESTLQLPDSGAIYGGAGRDWSLVHDGTTGLDVTVADNDAGALVIKEASTAYFTVDTTNSSESLILGVPLTVTAGMAAVLDLTSAATGEADVILADNLASAYSWREAATPYLTAVTTNSSEALLLGVPLTVTAGMAAVLDVSAAATGEADIVLGDALASALQVREAANVYQTFVTTDGAEKIEWAQNTGRTSTRRDLTHHTRWEKHDDLFGKADTEVDHEWILNSGTDAQAIDPALDTSQAGGVWQCVSGDSNGTVAADGSQMVWADMPIQLDSAGGVVVVEARLRIKSAITTVSVNFGLTDSTALEEPFTGATDTITAVANDAVGFIFDSANTTQEWFGAAVDSTTADTGNATTGVAPVADTWQILRMEISNNGATINFFVDNAVTADLALSGAAGVGPDVVLYPHVIVNATTTTSRTVDVDWVRVEGVR